MCVWSVCNCICIFFMILGKVLGVVLYLCVVVFNVNSFFLIWLSLFLLYFIWFLRRDKVCVILVILERFLLMRLVSFFNIFGFFGVVCVRRWVIVVIWDFILFWLFMSFFVVIRFLLICFVFIIDKCVVVNVFFFFVLGFNLISFLRICFRYLVLLLWLCLVVFVFWRFLLSFWKCLNVWWYLLRFVLYLLNVLRNLWWELGFNRLCLLFWLWIFIKRFFMCCSVEIEIDWLLI